MDNLSKLSDALSVSSDYLLGRQELAHKGLLNDLQQLGARDLDLVADLVKAMRRRTSR